MFRVDMSPLERASMNMAQGFGTIGRSIRSGIDERAKKQELQDMEALGMKAMSGDAEALNTLYAKDPKAGQFIEQRLNLQGQKAQEQEDRLTSQKAMDTADFVERMHLAPKEEQGAMFDEAVKDPRYDIDEEDRPHFMNPNARRALVGKVKTEEYAKSFFGDVERETARKEGQFERKLELEREKLAGQNRLKMSDQAFKRQQSKESSQLKKDLDKEKNVFDRSKKLRDEYTKRSGDFLKISDSYDRIVASADKPDAAGDLALIFNYMKVLDPGSTVRESEFATAQSAAGYPEIIGNALERIRSGKRLGTEQRFEFVNRAKKLYDKSKERNDKDKSSILDIGKRYGLQEQDIFGEEALPQEESQAVSTQTQYDALPSGAVYVEDGVKYRKP